VICQGCGAAFEPKLGPCPDGRRGCTVAHFDKDSFRCPKCGAGHSAATAPPALKEPALVVNADGIRRAGIDMSRLDDDRSPGPRGGRE
jgi:rubredoxin